MRPAAFGIAGCMLAAFSMAAHAECLGAVRGYWEKRAQGSQDAFEVIEEFRIDQDSGILSVCGREREWNAEFRGDAARMTFVYARRQRTLSLSEGGQFLSPSWIAEFQGVESEYRVRAEVGQ